MGGRLALLHFSPFEISQISKRDALTLSPTHRFED
jgi:hypothetical protein